MNVHTPFVLWRDAQPIEPFFALDWMPKDDRPAGREEGRVEPWGCYSYLLYLILKKRSLPNSSWGQCQCYSGGILFRNIWYCDKDTIRILLGPSFPDQKPLSWRLTWKQKKSMHAVFIAEIYCICIVSILVKIFGMFKWISSYLNV